MTNNQSEDIAAMSEFDWLSSREQEALVSLSAQADISPQATMRAALRLYQLDSVRRAAGEVHGWSGDAQRSADFAGPLVAKTSLAERIKYMDPPADLHTNAWLLGFCRARKMASDLAFLDAIAHLNKTD